MSLDALAPDQRAVVQLVLQQERSYDDLAGLLGISTEAVRERARAGLDRVGGSAGDLTDEERGEIADYLLGQQSVSRREATRALLSDSADARRWANRVSDAVGGVARSPLPGVPDATEDKDDDFEDDGPFEPAAPTLVQEPEPETAPALVEEEDDDEPAPVRARPRPRPDAPRPRPTGPLGGPAPDRPRASKVGGALLLAGIALIITVVVIAVVGGGDKDKESASDDATPTATASAAATPQAVGQIELKGVNGSKATGAMTIFATQDQKFAFTIEGTGVPVSKEGEAYAVWLTGGEKPKRLGFAPTVGDDGKLGVSGPRDSDAETFAQDFAKARKVVISRETSQDSTKPGPLILSGDVPRSSG
jgi:hypothetical protein